MRYVAIRRTGGDAQLAKITRRLVLAFGIIGMAAIVAVGTLGGRSSIGFGINNLTQLVGYSDSKDSFQIAFLWAQGGDGEG